MRGALVRSGFVAIGAIYVAMGIVSGRVALLGARDRANGVPGALRFLLEQPYGGWLLGAVVAALGGIALADGVRAARGPGGALQRIGLAFGGIGYAALAWTAGGLLLRAGRRARGVGLERQSASWLLAHSWGAFALELIGAAVIIGGLDEIVRGVRGKLLLRGDVLPRPLLRTLVAVSRFGLLMRGVTLVALGYFLIRAAEEVNPQVVRTFGETLDALAHTALGPAFLGVLAAGLASYGFYLWALALLRRRV
jgi:hypothetical protein